MNADAERSVVSLLQSAADNAAAAAAALADGIGGTLDVTV
jgi:hypothetical protein